MKDLSYLQAFNRKALRSAQMILQKGFTAEDIRTFLEAPDVNKETLEEGNVLAGRLEKPCCGEGKIDKELAETRAKQKERKAKRRERNGHSNTIKP